MRRGGIGTAAAVLALLLPAGANGAVITFDGAAAAGCSPGPAPTCKTFADAAAASGDGDTISVRPGFYIEPAAVTFARNDLTVAGTQVGASFVAVTGAAPDGAFVFSGRNATVQHLVVAATAGTGMAFTGPNPAPAGAHRLIRAAVTGTENGVVARSPAGGADPRRLVVESSVVSGGPSGSGVLVTSDPGPVPGAGAGPVHLEANHLTTAGQAKGIVLAARANRAAVPPFGCRGLTGDATANVTNSIVHGTAAVTEATPTPGDGLTTCASNAALPALTATDTSNNLALFVDGRRENFHLRADAAAIDKGLDPGAGEDLDGQPRRAGAATDLGADEFHNRVPTAALVAPNPPDAPQNRPMAFDATGSADPEAGIGGGIAAYRWSFGDGATQTTTEPTVQHAYANIARYTVTLVVVDRQGAESAPVTAQVSVRDGIPPALAITKPTAGQALRHVPRRTVRRRSCRTVRVGGRRVRRCRTVRRTVGGRPLLEIRGTVSDRAGVRQVVLALRRVAAGRCSWWTGTALAAGSCGAPRVFRARITNMTWRYGFPRTARLPAGTYQVYARATDLSGQTTATPAAAQRTLIAFRVR